MLYRENGMYENNVFLDYLNLLKDNRYALKTDYTYIKYKT